MESVQLLYFTAVWCQPCKVFGPRITAIAKQYMIHLVRIDADALPDLIEKYVVMSIPTVIVLKNGSEVDRLIGAKSEEQLLKILAPYKTEIA